MAAHVSAMLTERIRQNTGGGVDDLAISLSGDGITLHGRTATYRMMLRALGALREALPHFRIVNAILIG